ncbi:MAG: hypothetical protein J5J06_18125 [Phycisphaerae bacterium]|nr:hypothetical protein [Phycisphaerae bacterium]
MLTLFKRRKFLVVKSFRLHEEELFRPRPRLRELLGLLIHQAMHDGMYRIQLGVDAATKEPHLRYFGPVFYEEDKREWWEMVPAPARTYPRFLQICISLAQLSNELPLSGVIPALYNGKRIDLSFTVPDMNSFEIAWDQRYASIRGTCLQNRAETPFSEAE